MKSKNKTRLRKLMTFSIHRDSLWVLFLLYVNFVLFCFLGIIVCTSFPPLRYCFQICVNDDSEHYRILKFHYNDLAKPEDGWSGQPKYCYKYTCVSLPVVFDLSLFSYFSSLAD